TLLVWRAPLPARPAGWRAPVPGAAPADPSPCRMSRRMGGRAPAAARQGASGGERGPVWSATRDLGRRDSDHRRRHGQHPSARPRHRRLGDRVHQGFEAEVLDFFATVQDDPTACGTAMATGQRIIVDDVADNLIFAGSEARDVMLRAGARAVQSTPLWSRTGDLVGMLSTHYRRAGRPAERDLHRLDVLSR